MRTSLIFALSFLVFAGLSCERSLAFSALFAPVSSSFNDSQEPGSSVQNSDPEIQRAKNFLQKGLLQDAEQALRELLAQHSDSAEAHFLLGYVLFKEQKPEASLAEYTAGAKYHDPDPSDLKIVALNYVLLNDFSDADRWLTRSVAGNPNDPEGWYYLGRTKYNENRLEDATRAFKECLEIDPGNVKAATNLGLALQGLGKTDEALALYRHAIAMQKEGAPRNAEPFIDLGNLLLEQNQIDIAILNLSEGRDIAPQDSRARESLGKAYLRANRFPEAQAELEKAVSLAPDSAPAHYLLAQVYRKQGLMQRAKAEFDRAAFLNDSKSSIAPVKPML